MMMDCSPTVSLFPEGMPYRATKMWNELVKRFKEGIELKRKRWKMKYYYNCFSGAEALAWVHEYLKRNPNYMDNVTRTQAQLLCQKLLQQNILKDILPSCQITIFEESRLYSFTDKLKCKKEHNLRSSESKENKHSRDCSTRKGTPRSVKKKTSVSAGPRKPLGERTGLTNITVKESKVAKQRLTERKNGYKDNLIVFNNAVVESVDKDNSNITTTALSRKWRSACNISISEKQLGINSVKKPVMEKKDESPRKPETDVPVVDIVKSSSSKTTCTSVSEIPTSTSETTTNTSESQIPRSSSYSEVPTASSESEMLITCNSETMSNTSETTTNILLDKQATIPQEDNDLWLEICLERLEYSSNISSLNEILDYNSLSWKNVEENVKSNFKLGLQTVPTWLVAAMKYLIHWPSSKNLPGIGPNYMGFEKDVFKTILDHFQSTPEPLVPRCFLEIFTKISGLSTKCKLSAIRTLQHALLLLEKDKRQQLQLLLRFMVKISRNHVLNLSSDLPTRELVIQTFSPFIFSGNKNSGLTEVLGIRIASFVMDNYWEVFKVPAGLQYDVEQKIAFRQRKRQGNIKCQSESSNCAAITFCQRITNEEYEEQSRFVTQRSLEELLNSIVNDESITEKERMKKLKQFQKTYPEIYHSRFPTDELSVLSRKTERSLRHINKPLGFSIKSIR